MDSFEDYLAVPEGKVGLGSVDTHGLDDRIHFSIMVSKLSLRICISSFKSRDIAVLFCRNHRWRCFDVRKGGSVHISTRVVESICSEQLLEILSSRSLVRRVLERLVDPQYISIVESARHTDGILWNERQEREGQVAVYCACP